MLGPYPFLRLDDSHSENSEYRRSAIEIDSLISYVREIFQDLMWKALHL
jgi:hypothetical protein